MRCGMKQDIPLGTAMLTMRAKSWFRTALWIHSPLGLLVFEL